MNNPKFEWSESGLQLLQNINAEIAKYGNPKNAARLIQSEWKGNFEKHPVRYDIVVAKQIIKKHWDNLSVRELSILTNFSENAVSKIAARLGLPYKKHVFRRKPNQREYNSCVVLNFETGIFYGNMKEAAIAANMPFRTMQGYLRGERKNRTSYAKV